MDEFVIFDTSVLIENQRTAHYSERIASQPGQIRNSSVALAELWRGVTQAAERHFVSALEKSRTVLTPTESHWLESGVILAKIRGDQGFEPRRLRHLHFDVLIALSVRSYGALLIPSNRANFELIRDYRSFRLEVW
jgi:predicted nucleic acid-binding protein